MLHATTSPFKCTQASEGKPINFLLLSVNKEAQMPPSQAAARGANERRREHLPFKSGDVALLFNTQGFVLFPSSPSAVRKGRGCRFTKAFTQLNRLPKEGFLVFSKKSLTDVWTKVTGPQSEESMGADETFIIIEESLCKPLLVTVNVLQFVLPADFSPNEWKLNQM